jgi:glyoxylase-like metal-dependent hydrolase (beta-lactamase superfamily II)
MKASVPSSESLLAPTALGGVLARKGMRFQDLWLLQRLAVWAIDPLFRGCVNEGREDVDTFQFVDEKRKAFDVQRWQLKDRYVTKQLLAEVLSAFEAQHNERAKRKEKPISLFHLVAPTQHQDVWPLPDLIHRVHQSRWAYGPESIEYSESLEDLARRLRNLGVDADAGFVSERVRLDFRAGWAEANDHYRQVIRGLLLALGVAPSRAQDAANQLLVMVNTLIGELITREMIIDSMKAFVAPATAEPRLRRRRPAAESSERTTRQTPSPASHCSISYFPDEAVLLQFPDGTRGLIDCGPTAIRHIVPYLSSRSIDRLSFLAISHWHHTHYGGVPALLNAVSRIDHVWLTMQADPKSAIAKKLQDRRRGLGHSAQLVVRQLLDRKSEESAVHFGTGLEWIHRPDGETNADFVCAFEPLPDEYHLGREDDFNNLSATFLVRVAGQNLLLGGHAFVKRWERVLQTAHKTNIAFNADGFLLPHYASRRSLTPELIKALLNPRGSVALLPVSELMSLRFPNITDRKMLDHIRAAGGRIVMCNSTEPMHFVMNRDGLFQALSP